MIELERWKNDPAVTGNTEEAFKRITQVFINSSYSLDLTFLGLNTLSLCLSQLTWLKELNLSHNNFTTLPIGIEQLKKMQALDLSHNQLINISKIEKVRQLRTLFLNKTKIRSLPSKTSRLKSLKQIYCSSDQKLYLPYMVSPSDKYSYISMEEKYGTKMIVKDD